MSLIENLISSLIMLSSIALLKADTSASDASDQVEIHVDDKVKQNHEIDSVNLLMYVGLLIVTVLTVWLFKHRRLRFVHETGLAIIYGLLVGIVIRYTSKNHSTAQILQMPDNSTCGDLPDNVILDMGNCGDVSQHKYKYNGPINSAAAQEGWEEKATFDPEVFFNVLLPPIIFHAGYSMKRRHFFKNFGAIITYAFLGTAVSCFVVGALMFAVTRMISIDFGFSDCLLFGAIISATDPVTVLAIFNDLNVDVDLYAIVFGESVLNDAVAIVLSGSVLKYRKSAKNGDFDGAAVLESLGSFVGIFFGSFVIGSSMGCLNAALTKFTRISEYPLLETSLFMLMSYGSFLAGEATQTTGIVAVLFCGICQAHYTYNNLSTESKARTKDLFELLNFLMENFVFTYIGVSVFTFTQHEWNAVFIIGAFVAVIVGRACNIYPLSFLLNLGRSNKIRYNLQHMMMFSGLRGAIAFALAIRMTSDPAYRLMFSTTLLIVISTVILCGGFSTQMLQWLKIRVGVEEEERELQNFEAVRTSPSAPLPAERTTSASRFSEKAWLVLKWYNIDAKFVKPLLTHARPPLTETFPACCLPLTRLLTSEQQLSQSNGQQNQTDSDTEPIVDMDDGELMYDDLNGTTSATSVANETETNVVNHI